MKLEQQIARIIREEAEKLIERYHEYHNRVHIEAKRNQKRLGDSAPKKKIHTPDYWSFDRKFSPFYVKAKHKSIARSIASKIENRTYSPNAPYIKEVPKPDGGIRKVAIYQIPDAAISKFFFNRLLAKNRHRFSSFSYAYRNDRNVHFAIQDISVDLKRNERTFLAEFDFSDFFGSISHEFLKGQFSENGFYISPEERFVIKSFLKESKVGIPQGTSISLFLANLTCWKFDQDLEREGVKFSRYADDTIVWSPEYAKVCNSFGLINEFSRSAGIKINPTKSEGISLLTKDGLPSEIVAKTSLDFLGYCLSVDNVSIKDKSVKKIQKQISYILYRSLIQPLKQTVLTGQRIPANDSDYNFLSAMCEIRRYMYGGLSKKQIKDYLSGRTKRIYFKGVMSFYPLVDDVGQLTQLDGWLLSVVHRVLKLRCKLLSSHGFQCSHSFPFNVSRSELLERCAIEVVSRKNLLEIPSFLLIHRALKKGLEESGIERVMNPDSLNYDYR
ncbi:reverse transcriptase domain-containing protein [Francisella adeliensis]|uniref:RNA-dependent DNA polymerase n=1 Tax=Francisella adeliensis TaxID=2007306 RepID=A0A2Z4Y0V2_9GAMM|nr:reverse transcriptase domain-containing protein [Francisella adeliensis]AXA34559.1 RNA-dependent DNA polymerase [Francisella adeliensis]MBK2086283.1 RNA-dependent DNA polymerase [Francisella adeliensis]MBK2096500.1 RNA-dependent DNA polymerase [Francisella adeliensis]QIW12806.1 RNA-dependent DNA polymerase [Francisella adeliensis]QIW14684.1 RNA-dependent DNA polymerase [Francisella adeliensis]